MIQTPQSVNICASAEVSRKGENSLAALPLGDQACWVSLGLLLFTHYLNLLRAWLKRFPGTGSPRHMVDGGQESAITSMQASQRSRGGPVPQLCWARLGKVPPPETPGVSNVE